MAIATPPKPPPVQPEPEALIEEARRRTRRRRLKYAGAGVAAILVGGGIYAGLELASGSPAQQAIPPGFQLVNARGPVSHVLMHNFPSRTRVVDLSTGRTETARGETEVWWDRRSGLTRQVERLDGNVVSDGLRNSCVGRVCIPPPPWDLAKLGYRWPPAACCAFVAGRGEFEGRKVFWVEGLVNGRRSTHDIVRVGFDARTHQPVVEEQFFGKSEIPVVGYTMSWLQTLKPQDVSFVVPKGGAAFRFPSNVQTVRTTGLAASRTALGTDPVWLGRSYLGSRLRTVDVGTASATTETRHVLRRVPFVRFAYGSFAIEEYRATRRPYGFESGPAEGTAFLITPGTMILVRDGVFMTVTATTINAARALALATALRPIPTE
jgi:hypothetical protein